MNILGALLALAAFVIAIWIGGDIYAFIDISSILFVGGGIFAAIIARHGFSGFKSLFNPNEGVEVYATVATAGMASGVL
jgi:flagellar motor component MotA